MAVAWRVGATVVLPLLLVASYAVLSHWLMVHQANAPLAVALLFGPLLLALAAAGWRKRQWATLAACAVLLGVLVVVTLRGGVPDAQRLYVLQHAAIHLALAWGFLITLRQGEKPLITLLAEGVHGRLGQAFPPALAGYTRGVTQLWAGYFLGMVLLSLLLYLRTPWDWWSFFCTVITPLAAVLLFFAEHHWRYRRHPEFPRVTPRAAFEAYQRHDHGGPAR